MAAHSWAGRSGSSSRTDRSQGRSAAELYVLWRASHNSGMVWQGYPLYWMALHGGSFRPLTHSIRSQGRQLVLAISSIFASKNLCFVALVVLRKVLLFLGVLSSQYWRRVSEHVSFHHSSDQRVIRFSVTLSDQALEKTSATACAIASTSAIVVGVPRQMPQYKLFNELCFRMAALCNRYPLKVFKL